MSMPPLGWAFYSLALVAILFEPLRLALWHLGQAVGGVGGVGGLTNQYICNTTRNATSDYDDDDGTFCFETGWLGFTPFGGSMLLLCMLPLIVAGLAAHRQGSVRKGDEEEMQAEQAAHGGSVTVFCFLGISASSLWFLVPLAYFAADSFYQTDAYHSILAVAIAAAYPLSWHLSFVAIPSSGAPFLAPLLGLSSATLKACHVRAAWATLFWGSVHAVGELIYLASQRNLDVFAIPTSVQQLNEGANLIFIFGLALFLLLLVLSAHALSRKLLSVAPTFRRIHGPLAATLLMIAAAHWWPFAIFLAPAIACAATGRAVKNALQASSVQSNAPLALVAAVTATLAGIASVWAARQAWMVTHPTDYYTLPVNLFPPTAVGWAYVLARGSAAAALALAKRRAPITRASEVSREAPLIGPLLANS